MSPQDVSSWHAFEDVVAELYRALGASVVRQNVNLAGSQIDIYVEETTATGQTVRTAVECKYFSKAVPKDSVVQFATIASFLRQSGIIDKATMVGYLGFTQAASLAAEAGKVELLAFAELEARVERRTVRPDIHGARVSIARIIREAERKRLPAALPQTVFVAMPFSEDMEDVYIYGIRKSVQEVGLQCKRADEIEHGGPIVTEIIDYIKRSRIIIAEVSSHNPNVFYEVGWAHALQRETILVARDGIDLPFDIRHINTIVYRNIHQLEERLRSRLSALLKQ